MDWSAGSRSGRVRYRDVRRVRLSFKPVSMQTHRFLTEIWVEGAPKLADRVVVLEEHGRAGAARRSLCGLHHRTACPGRARRAPVPVRYEQGANPFLYWPGLALYIVVALALAGMFVRALQVHAFGGAAFIGGFVALFLWQGGNFFRRNRPGTYRPDALPDELMPRA